MAESSRQWESKSWWHVQAESKTDPTGGGQQQKKNIKKNNNNNNERMREKKENERSIDVRENVIWILMNPPSTHGARTSEKEKEKPIHSLVLGLLVCQVFLTVDKTRWRNSFSEALANCLPFSGVCWPIWWTSSFGWHRVHLNKKSEEKKKNNF